MGAIYEGIAYPGATGIAVPPGTVFFYYPNQCFARKPSVIFFLSVVRIQNFPFILLTFILPTNSIIFISIKFYHYEWTRFVFIKKNYHETFSDSGFRGSHLSFFL